MARPKPAASEGGHNQVLTLEDETGAFRAVRLSDGTEIAADLCIVAMGAQPNVEWLDGSGLDAGPGGLRCDVHCRAMSQDGTPHPFIFTAGDVALWPCPLYGGEEVSIGHWSNAVEQARIAASNMLAGADRLQIHSYLPTFWSNQARVTVKAVGHAGLADEVKVAQGALEEGRFVAIYGRQGKVVAAVSVDYGLYMEHYAYLVRTCAEFPPPSIFHNSVEDEPPEASA
ncbi:hypothetical protein GQY15_12815 [Rhodobacter sphaeroides]|uniref:FAD-dependent oxidoreductase n=1 Tax=Cereibacter sphaeroides TaxID=1063 RepID=UPI0013225C70|nr:FAD-dependent oxidoreductase [Cereibacter sphaeroides]MWP38476.1 hypothetical protein [Cereibacter sphaeroides]